MRSSNNSKYKYEYEYERTLAFSCRTVVDWLDSDMLNYVATPFIECRMAYAEWMCVVFVQ